MTILVADDIEYHNFKTLDRRVGVVIATRNRAHYLPAALHSVLSQTHAAERIIVVDDGSTDNTREVVDGFSEVEYVRIKSGKGCAFPRNVGCKMLADLPYILAIDDDDYIPPDYIGKLLDAIETDCRAAVAYPRVQQFGMRTALIEHEYDPALFARSNYVCNTSLVRTDALRQIGWWPEAKGFEDWSAWRRLVGHGWRMVQADTTYFWRRHADSVTGRSMADHLDGPFMEAWLRAATGFDGWVVHTSRAGIAARIGNVFLSVQPDTWQASQAWERELRKRGMLDQR